MRALTRLGLVAVGVVTMTLSMGWLSAERTGAAPQAQEGSEAAEIAKLRAEVDQLRGRLPDQSHVMKDVGYHFANLWFAGQAKNWPLARFYRVSGP